MNIIVHIYSAVLWDKVAIFIDINAVVAEI